jgi:hypothetical protein
MDEKERSGRMNFWVRTWAIFLGVPVAWILVGWVLPQWLSDDPVKRSAFGDMFGAANALFSGLAFCGLVVTLLLQGQATKVQNEQLKLQNDQLEMQREELALQRDEMRQMREQYERTATAQEGSEQIMERQAKTALLAAQITGLTGLLQSLASTIPMVDQMVRVQNAEMMKRHHLELLEAVEKAGKLLNNN